jgi:formamidase
MMTTVAVRGREPLFKIDLSKSFDQQTIVGHNRWHPDIPPVLSVKPDNVFRIECKDWTDGQIKNDDSANDVRDVHLQRVHVLSGPIAVEGAEPGDLHSRHGAIPVSLSAQMVAVF